MTATQLDAVRVLTGIIRRGEEADLPRLAWDVRPYTSAGLSGQPWGGTDDERAAVVAAWARHLDVEVTTEKHDTYVSVSLATRVHGIRVRIFAHTARTYTYVSVPAVKAGAES